MLVDVTAAVLDGAVRKGEEFGLLVCSFECQVEIDKILVASVVLAGFLATCRPSVKSYAVIRITAKARVDIVRSFNPYAVFQGTWSLCHGLSRI